MREGEGEGRKISGLGLELGVGEKKRGGSMGESAGASATQGSGS